MDENTNNITSEREYPHFLVDSEVLLYKLSDAGLLCNLHKVIHSKRQKGKRLWLFDKNEYTKSVIDIYKSEQADLAQ